MILESEAFANGEHIPRRCTCDGDDMSPALSWREAPTETASFALVVDDPDAPKGTWVHWVLFNVPASEGGLDEDAEKGSLPEGTVEGVNSWGRRGYGGPCPPSGSHRYFFKLYALDRRLQLGAGASADDVAEAIEGHVLAEAALMGRYARS